jgi:phosphoribosylformylglycinamidine synthase
MEYKVEARIELKPGVIDAEGETVSKSLGLLGFRVGKVRSIKAYEISVEAPGEKEAVSEVENACKKLLANPVIQNYSVRII